MPHYADGTEASVGDHVFGVLYNSGPSPKAGVIVSITPGAESCNAMVQFSEALFTETAVPRMALHVGDPAVATTPMCRRAQSEAHGTAGKALAIYTCCDYCATSELTKVSRP